MKNLGLVPLVNFGLIQGEVYRSAQPEYTYQFAWLKEHAKIKHIVNLRSESILTNRKGSKFGFKVTHIPINDHQPPSLDQVDQFQSIIAGESEPILIHCAHGHGRTSTMSVIAKLTLGMSLEDALKDEEKRFHYQFRHHAQIEFLKHFQQVRLTA